MIPGELGRVFPTPAIPAVFRAPGAELIVVETVRIIRRSRLRGMAQSGSAPALGAGSRGFESLCPDQRGVSSGHQFDMRP